jgi:hypothetical protein
MNNLNFEVGKAYQTRDGRKAVCLTTTATEYDGQPIVLQIEGRLIYVTILGRYHNLLEVDNYDIIGEWIDKPVIDWSLMPAWAKFVTMDKSGKWWWYTHKPSLEHAWCIIEGFVGKIPSEYAPKWEGDWEDSLIERP